jgi:NAD(P) transhydrogenase
MTVNLRGADSTGPSIQFNIPTDMFDPNHVASITEASHLFVAMCFMYALKSLGNPETATRGNVAGIVGMTVAISTAWLNPSFSAAYKASFCLVSAAVVGIAVARKAEMIMMPVLVAAFHAMVGLAAVLVAFARYFDLSEAMNASHLVETIIGVFFGALTLTGSVVAAGKLHGTIASKSLLLPFRHWINGTVVLATIGLTYQFAIAEQGSMRGSFILFVETALSLFLGWHLVMSIGGADMPVIVSTLNSYSGWTTVAAGFLLENNLLIIAGSLIGSSGAILSYIMCKGMNRSFTSVILGGFGVEEGTHVETGGEVTEINTAELASELVNAKSVVIVPGYGMAVSRCQQTVAQITDVLRHNGVKVRFAIHPVAGRLPGHMNVLLAEANVPYDIVYEMEKINEDFPETDVSIVLGANDIVNPLAVEDLSSPIGGMPVLEVWKAKRCVVMKRSMATGYSGIDNPLFYKENVRMFFGNAKEKTTELLAAVQGLIQTRAQRSTNTGTPSTIGALTQPLLSETVVASALAKSFPPAVKTLGVLNEALLNDLQETRVAISPNSVPKLRELGFDVVIEKSAGLRASFPDRLFAAEGCKIADSADAVISSAQVLVYIGAVPSNHYDKFRPGQVVIGYFWPAFNKDTLKELASRKVVALSMDAVPRITRAQKLDSLSSMANLAGYRAVIQGFNLLPRFSKPLTTAAGQVPPAKVFVIGAGVAGLSAIGTARSLGAVVRANDTRPVVKEQVESMGAEFVEVQVKEDASGAGGYAKETSKEFQVAQLALYAKICADSDIVITTAQIPGKPAPRLVTKEIVRSMKPGSVLVDLAAGQGGNVELTVKDKTITDAESGVVIVGNSNLSRDMAAQASELYSANIGHLLNHVKGAGALDSAIANPDEILGPMRCTFNGSVTYAPVSAPPPAPAPAAKPKKDIKPGRPAAAYNQPNPLLQWTVFIGILCLIGFSCFSVGKASDINMVHQLMAFVMAVIIGYFLVWSVDPALHTPLMSVTNAVSGIIVLGGLVQLDARSYFAVGCAMVGTFCALCNVFGGFLITQRMLYMFKR